MRQTKNRELHSMVKIASKHDLQPEQLVDALNEALRFNYSQCGSLNISCRAVNQDAATFLITRAEKVIWQASVNLETITDPYVKDSIKKIPMPEKKIEKLNGKLKIGELRFGMKRINVTAEIVEILPTRLVKTRWGMEALVSNAKIADETGSIDLPLWNNQIKMFHVGDQVDITNCNVTRFLDKPQLKIARKGAISAITRKKEELIAPNLKIELS